MATLTYQKSKLTGSTVLPVSASAGGDKIKPNPNGALLVQNTDASSKTVTVVIPGNTKFGQAEPDITRVVAASAFDLIGPFPLDAADSDDFMVDISYSAVTGVKVAAIEI